jgi:hypothetical protein
MLGMMDPSIVPILLFAMVAGIWGSWIELRAALNPPACPNCPHCRDRAEQRRLERIAAERRQAELQSLHAHRWQIGDDEDEERRRD